MSAQFDFIAGLDISSLTSVTQAQFMQAINQLAPLSNIGGVITQAASSSAQTIAASSWAISGCPDVGNNPRFAKYVWLNSYTTTPIPFFYDSLSGNWTASSYPANSVHSGVLKKTGLPVVAGGTSTTIEHLVSDANGNVTSEGVLLANKLLVYDGAGQYITEISKTSLASGLQIDPAQITAGGSTGNVLKIVGGVSTYAPIDLNVAHSDPLSFTGKLHWTAIQPGASGFLLVSGASAPAWVSNNDASSGFLAAGNATTGIALSKLKGEGVANDLVISNGTNITVVGQSLRIGTAAAVSTTGLISRDPITPFGEYPISNRVHTIPHGLNAIPKLIRVVLVQRDAVADLGWAQNEEINIECYRNSADTVQLGYGANATNVTIVLAATAGELPAKTTGTFATADSSKWVPKVYAWL